MKLRTIFLLALVISGLRRADAEINPAAFARTINSYVALGEKRSLRLFTKQIDKGEFDDLLCLVLFEPKPGHEMRAIQTGSLVDLPDSPALGRWPILPLALSGNTYFILNYARLLTGWAEEPRDYLSFCRANGIFRTKAVPVPTHAEALRAANTLRRSTAWKALFKGHARNENYVWEHIKEQVEATR